MARADTPEAGLRHVLTHAGDRWSLLVVQALERAPRRFVDLLEGVSGIAPNILSGRLKRLEASGVVTSAPYSERPVRLAYDLTPSGRELLGALRPLAEWGARRTGGEGEVRHVTCGTSLETRWYCPTCERVAEEEGDELDFV